MASRRKRGPVAVRPRLSAGLALSVLYVNLSIVIRTQFGGSCQCPQWVVSGPFD